MSVPELPPAPPGDPDHLLAASGGFSGVAAEADALGSYLRDVTERLVTQGWRGAATVDFTAHCDMIQDSIGQAGAAAAYFAAAGRGWADDLRDAQAQYATAERDYQTALEDWIAIHRALAAPPDRAPGQPSTDELGGQQQLLEELKSDLDAAVAAAAAAVEQAEDAARIAAAAFDAIEPPRLGDTGTELSGLDLGFTTAGELAGALRESSKAAGGTGAGWRAAGAVTNVAGFALPAIERWSQDADNPRLDDAQRRSRALMDSLVRGSASLVVGGGAAAFGGILAGSGPPGWILGAGLGIAGALGADTIATQALADHRDEGVVPPPPPPAASSIPLGTPRDERLDQLGFPAEQLLPRESPAYSAAIALSAAGPPPPAELADSVMPDITPYVSP